VKHRTDIDGLRAVAIIPILLFHAGLTSFSGGFLGVDIFFVISGFLITGIIVRELDAGTFSIASFYKRRIARIFPALFVLIAATLLLGIVFLLPSELAKVGWASIFSLTFSSNIYFWKTLDYFGGFAETSPLLHTWSLGVEEQFYILYPLYIALVAKYARQRMRAAILLLIAASIAAALAFYFIKPQAAFYLLPARAWQLALGGLVAVGGFPTLRGTARTAGALLGAVLIVLSTLLVRPEWMLPFPWGALPSLGAALLIAFGENGPMHRLLAVPPMRWIGAISYSLYLWHWPIIAFYRINTGLELDPVETVGLIVASLVAATASYLIVEQPALRRFRNAQASLTIGSGLAGMALLCAAAAFLAINPRGWRTLSPEVERVATFADYKNTPAHAAQYREGKCFSTDESAPLDYAFCARVDPTRGNIALIGDSHAAQYWGTLQRLYPDHNVIQLTSSGCRVILNSAGKDRCTKLADFVYGEFVTKPGVSDIILAGRWQAGDVDDLQQTVRMLRAKGFGVIVLGPIFEFEGEFPLLLARALEMGAPENMERFRLRNKVQLDTVIQRAVVAAGGQYYSVQNAECRTECAYLVDRKVPVHFDYGHVTAEGADYLLRDLRAQTRLAGR
jgi:peptidoglycan/LPS O-acetylase OafA/YrhL